MPEDADKTTPEELATLEEQREELEDLLEKRPEVERFKVSSILVLGIFYTLMAGFVLGMLMSSAKDNGLWDRLFGAEPPPPLPKVEEEAAGFYLFGELEDQALAELRNPSSHLAHGKAMAAIDFAAMGLEASDHSLFALRLINMSKDTPLVLSRETFHVVLEDQSGAEYRSLALPESAKGDVQAMRLRQHSPAGEIPARVSEVKDKESGDTTPEKAFERQLWVIFKGEVALKDIKGGRIEIGAEKIELNTRTDAEGR